MSMVIYDGDFVWPVISPYEDDAPLLVNTYGVIPCEITFECFQTISRWHSKILPHTGPVHLDEFSQRNALDGMETAAFLRMKEALRLWVGKGLDHVVTTS